MPSSKTLEQLADIAFPNQWNQYEHQAGVTKFLGMRWASAWEHNTKRLLGGQRMGYVLSIAMFAVVYGIFAWLIKLFDKA